MDFEKLRYFCAVAKEESIRGAAKALGLSPAALSKAVKQLEIELGMALLVPDGRGIAVSDEGKLLAERAESLLRDVKDLRESVRVRLVEVKPVKIGTFEVFATYFLRKLLQKKLLGVPVLIHDLIPGNLEQALIEGRIDIGISYIPVVNAELTHTLVGRVEHGLFAKPGIFNGYRFSDIPFVVPVKPIHGTPTRVEGLDGWPDDKMLRTVKYQVRFMESAIEICEMGLAAAFLPKFVVRLHNQRVVQDLRLTELPIPAAVTPEPQPVYLIRRKSLPMGPIHHQISRILRSLDDPKAGA